MFIVHVSSGDNEIFHLTDTYDICRASEVRSVPLAKMIDPMNFLYEYQIWLYASRSQGIHAKLNCTQDFV